MEKNVGNVDKIVRVVVGLGLLSLLFFLKGNARYWGLVGLIPLGTAATGWCPGWSILGINTCPVKGRERP
ncbi:MAG: hypothetical protein B7Z66_07035 [Chromatiales bacterium 21-64-14]|nr:MAG: hypothetical protein B7Z66_07035 [Chromatiales bacterium 21-64-14]HQU16572.1 DUF2892 domain-containing protein [Gammaproteobacteria bacterium]